MDLVSHDVVLDAGLPGRASFTINSTDTPSGVVLFSFSVNNGKQHSQFYGYIERSIKVSDGVWSIFCREKSNALEMRVPIALRNKTLKDILSEVKTLTGIGFAIPSSDYSVKSIPYCVNTGSGFHLMKSLESMFGIEDYIWQQRRDGLVFIGAWSDGHWPDNPVTIPSALLDKQSSNQTAEILAIPGLRPNYLLNGKRLKSVRMEESKMVVSWKK